MPVKLRKITGLVLELIMYAGLVGCLFSGSEPICALLFWAALAGHLLMKRRWFTAVWKRLDGKNTVRFAADVLIAALLAALAVWAATGSGLWLAFAAALTTAHSGMHGCFTAKDRKKMALGTAVCSAAVFALFCLAM